MVDFGCRPSWLLECDVHFDEVQDCAGVREWFYLSEGLVLCV
jgi:hypothetical protein